MIVLKLLAAVSVLATSVAADCSVSCNQTSGPCNGVSGNVDIRADPNNPNNRLITVSANGNGGSGSNTESWPNNSDHPVTTCIGGPPACCVSVAPCTGENWGSAGSDCSKLCVDCFA